MPGDLMQGVIYKYTSQNGKIYVGQTLILERKRIDKHKYEAFTKHCDTPFGHAIRKYGWDIIRASYTVIETVEAEDRKALKAKLTERENYWIETLDTFVPKGYNVKLTNQHTLSEYRNKAAMYAKVSATLKGKHLNEKATSKPVIDMTTGKQYPSISEAARDTGLLVQSICRMLKSKQLQTGGHKFCYIDETGNPDTSNIRTINRKQLPVYCPELDRTFVSAYEAAKYIGKPDGKANIRIAAETGKKRSGLTWIYKQA